MKLLENELDLEDIPYTYLEDIIYTFDVTDTVKRYIKAIIDRM